MADGAWTPSRDSADSPSPSAWRSASSEGLPTPLPSPLQGEALGFQLIGNATLHEVTKEVSLDVVATLRRGTVAGRATGTLLFTDFKITKPAVPVLVSVDGKIQIEVEFRATRSAP